MNRHSRTDQSEALLMQEAADWFARLEAGERDCHAAFLDWVRQSPLHVREFLAVTELSRQLIGIDPQRRRDVRQLAAQGDVNVVPLQPEPAMSPAAPPTNRRAWRWAGMAAAMILAIGAALVVRLEFAAQHYATGVGEQSLFKLPDGSLINLNTQSRAEVRYDEHARRIELTAGEALFTVAPDPARPFQVSAGSAVIEAVGTQFNVYRQSGGTKIAVVEGRVRVRSEIEHRGQRSDAAAPRPDAASSPEDSDAPLGEPPGTALLAAGEGAQVDARGGIVREVGAVDQAIAWRQRLLEFKDTPLSEAAAEFNRYNAMQLRIEGATARNLRVTGFFNVDNPQGLLRFLERDSSLSITRDGENVTVLGRL